VRDISVPIKKWNADDTDLKELKIGENPRSEISVIRVPSEKSMKWLSALLLLRLYGTLQHKGSILLLPILSPCGTNLWGKIMV
jgi:hypothetical protein